MNSHLETNTSTRVTSALFALLLTVFTLAGVNTLAQTELGHATQMAQTHHSADAARS